MTNYFAKRNVADAAKWSQEGKISADELAEAARAAATEKSVAAFKTLSGTCRPCHDVHREKQTDGSYKFK